jgi:hypothetical protein
MWTVGRVWSWTPRARMLAARVAVRAVAGWQPDLPMAVEQVVVRDMMIDGVAPSPGVRPLILSWPSAVIDGDVGGGAV